MRRSLPSPGLALLVVRAACKADPAGPRRGGPAYLAVQPVFGSAVELASFGLIADTVRLDVVRPPADTLRTLTVFFDPDSSQIRLGANVALRVPVETLAVHLELRGGGFALFSGTAPVEVRAGQPGTPHEILLAYTGPGSNVASVTIAPRDTVLTFGDSLRFHVTARDLAGAPDGRGWARCKGCPGAVPRVGSRRGRGGGLRGLVRHGRLRPDARHARQHRGSAELRGPRRRAAGRDVWRHRPCRVRLDRGVGRDGVGHQYPFGSHHHAHTAA